MKFLDRINLDFIGFSASFLCAIHCGAVPIILASAALSGFYWFSDPIIEVFIILLSFVIATFSLTRGLISQHKLFLPVGMALFGFMLLIAGHLSQPLYEAVLSCMAGLSIASAHLLNYRLVRKSVRLAS